MWHGRENYREARGESGFRLQCVRKCKIVWCGWQCGHVICWMYQLLEYGTNALSAVVCTTHEHSRRHPRLPFNNADFDLILSPLSFKLRTTGIAAFTDTVCHCVTSRDVPTRI